jgi:hypothetical protein
LNPASEATRAHLLAAFKQSMQGLGLLEGKHVEYPMVYAGSDARLLGPGARELVGQHDCRPD